MKNDFKIIDAHCHIYPEKIASRAVSATDNFYGIKSVYGGTVKELMGFGTDAGVDHFIVQSVATSPSQVTSINEFIAKSVFESNGKLTGLGTLHPDSTTLNEDVNRIKSLNLHGVKLHPDIQRFKIDDYRCLKIYELCERENLPILMHTGDYRYDFSNPNRLKPVMEIFTNLTVIGAHLGGWSVWKDAAKNLSELPNLYVDCSSSFNWMDKETAEKVIRAYGCDRVLFGTDFPMWSFEKELEFFFSLDFTDKERNMILSENAQRVFKFHI